MTEAQPTASPSTNPLMMALRSRIPGETFRLPSQGLFYTDGELSDDVVDGEVHVFPLTALDEITIKTPDKLLSGKAIEDVFIRCIPQVKKPMKLLSKDVDYLMMCLRLISYGDEMDITYTHTCENAKNQTYGVALRPLIARAKPIDPTSLGTTFTIKVGGSMLVKLRPPVFESVINMYMANFQSSNQSISLEEAQRKLLDVITSTIISVDGEENVEHIQEWVKAIPAGWMQQIGEAMQSLGNWGPSTAANLVCKDCGEEMEVEIPLNPIAFFS